MLMGSTAFGQQAQHIYSTPNMTALGQPGSTSEFFATQGARSGGWSRSVVPLGKSDVVYSRWEKSVHEQLGFEEGEEPILMSYRRQQKKFYDVDSFYSIRFVASQNPLFDPNALGFALAPPALFLTNNQDEDYLPLLDNVRIAAVPVHSSGWGLLSATASFGVFSAFRRKRRAQV